MNIVTIHKKEYEALVRRQRKVEEELNIVKFLLKREIDEEQIKPSALKRWERISRDMDSGKTGHVFYSFQEMRKWLRDL